MSRLVHFSIPSSPSSTRIPEQVLVTQATSSEDSRSLAGMLLAAVMAALLVTADQVINSWVDGHLLAAWVALWTVTFAALALLATPLRKISNAGANWVSALMVSYQERRKEEEMWELARHDYRVMAEIRTASVRQMQV